MISRVLLDNASPVKPPRDTSHTIALRPELGQQCEDPLLVFDAEPLFTAILTTSAKRHPLQRQDLAPSRFSHRH